MHHNCICTKDIQPSPIRNQIIMARCEDYPCCGHELGCCPDFDENGRQLNMICVCGAKLPIDNPSSICDACMRSEDEEEFGCDYYDEEFGGQFEE